MVNFTRVAPFVVLAVLVAAAFFMTPAQGKKLSSYRKPKGSDDDAPLYKLNSFEQTSNGYTGVVNLASGSGPFGGDVNDLRFDVTFETQQRIHVKLTDKEAERWQVPGVSQATPPDSSPEKMDYDISFESNPFGFTVTRKSNSDVIFSTQNLPFVFSDQYIELSTQLSSSSPNIYGFGERVFPMRLENDHNYTIFSRDIGTPYDENLYGSHPFYMEVRNGVTHGVLLLNSNGMQVSMQGTTLTYKIIGGVVDFYIFLGPNPEQVVKQYQEVIGLPYFPPYWGFGFHQCRWGYKNISETWDVALNYEKYGIPLDTMWNDIDYMNGYRDFTTDPVNYPTKDVAAFADYLHSKNQQYIVMTDPGIKIDPDYFAYIQGVKADIFIKNAQGQNANGTVWPGLTHFPDFLNPNTYNYWLTQIKNFHSSVSFDGLWIDMNEIATNCNGDDPCLDESKKLTPEDLVAIRRGTYEGKPKSQGKPTPQVVNKSNYVFNPNNPPFLPGDAALDHKTIMMDSVMYNNTLYYDAHNLYGYLETIATSKALEQVRKKRSVVISRSTYPGSGHHGGHWLGDNASNWKDLYYSIPGIIMMNIFGIPFVGADICGFNDNTNAELCARWMQLGSFYPFSRNHNCYGSIPQEPYVFGAEVAEISRNALLNRYSLLPYYYTLFYHTHTEGGTAIRPMLFEYPTNSDVYGIDQQFMIGPAILVSPVLTEGATSVTAYFPDDVWYDYYSGEQIKATKYYNLSAPLTHIPVHIRGGFVVPRQRPSRTTKETRQNPYWLQIALDNKGSAEGDLFMDDGDSLDSVANKEYSLIKYQVATQSDGTGILKSSAFINSTEPKTSTLDKIVVYGVQAACSVNINGQQVDNFYFDLKNKKLSIHDMDISMATKLHVVWSC